MEKDLKNNEYNIIRELKFSKSAIMVFVGYSLISKYDKIQKKSL